MKPVPPATTTSCEIRHLRIGWIGLWIFLGLGILLEILHAFKVGYYLNVSNSTRRFMWTLAHSHGTLFSVVHIVFALSLSRYPEATPTRQNLTSWGLTLGWLLLPLGFFLGGIQIYDGDPGLGIFLVPLGAISMWVGVGVWAWHCLIHPPTPRD